MFLFLGILHLDEIQDVRWPLPIDHCLLLTYLNYLLMPLCFFAFGMGFSIVFL